MHSKRTCFTRPSALSGQEEEEEEEEAEEEEEEEVTKVIMLKISL